VQRASRWVELEGGAGGGSGVEQRENSLLQQQIPGCVARAGAASPHLPHAGVIGFVGVEVLVDLLRQLGVDLGAPGGHNGSQKDNVTLRRPGGVTCCNRRVVRREVSVSIESVVT